MNFSEVVSEPDGRYFRFMKTIGVKPMCLQCHGSAEQIPPTSAAMLSKLYPNDRAVGYAAGDLRGASSVKLVRAIVELERRNPRFVGGSFSIRPCFGIPSISKASSRQA